MDYSFTTIGALIGMAVAIILIIKKVQPAYSLIFGALIGGVIGSGNLILTVDTMVSGAQSMISSVLRIMTSGILAGTLIKTGAAEKIAEVIVQKLGEKRALIAVAAATMVICAVGVFVDISVITVAPIAGILMAGATASTTAGSTIASQTFAQTLLNAGIPAISAGAMIHAGSTVIDSLPHGSFFHATGGSVGMNIKERMKLIPFEACIGLTSTIVAVIVYLI